MRKTISISKQVKRELDDYREDRSVNKALNTLLDDVDDTSRDFESGRINITIDDDVYDRLVLSRAYSDEPFSSVIHRILTGVDGK